MVNISQSLGSPTIFIRYNPDEYKLNGKKKDPPYVSRMKQLELTLRTTLNMKPEELIGYCTMRKLYFDEYVKTNTDFYSILDFEKKD